jgi:O-antigen/teichoic acid export membrane protein
MGLLFRNAGALVVSQAVTKIVNVAVSLVMVRWLGPVELGTYAYISAFCYPFGALTDIGLGSLVIREISRDRAREPVLVAALSRLLLQLAVIALAAMGGVALLTPHDRRTLLGIGVVALATPLTALTTPSLVALIAREQMYLVSVFQIVRSGLGSLVTLAVLLAGGTVIPLLLGAAATNLIMLGVARWLEGRRPVLPPVAPSVTRALLRQAVPFGLVLIGFTIYYRLDMIMLHWMRDTGEVGRYAAAYRFLDALLVLGAALGGPFYPRLSTMAGRDREGMRIILDGTWSLMAGLAIPLAVGTTLVATPLSLTLFGSQFADAANPLRILIWAGVPILLIVVPGHAMNAIDRVWYLAAVYGTSVLANIAANLLLIPRFGAEGAGVATVVCAWLNLGLVIRCIRRDTGAALPWPPLWRYPLAAAGMAAALVMAAGLGLAVEIPLGAAAYAGCLLLLGYQRSADFQTAKALLRQ